MTKSSMRSRHRSMRIRKRPCVAEKTIFVRYCTFKIILIINLLINCRLGNIAELLGLSPYH